MVTCASCDKELSVYAGKGRKQVRCAPCALIRNRLLMKERYEKRRNEKTQQKPKESVT